MLDGLVRWVAENVHLFYRYVLAAAVLVAFYYVSRVASRSISTLRVDLRPEEVHNLQRLVKAVVLTAGVLVALSILGVDLRGLLVAAGFTGLVVGLAAQQTLGNLFAGLALILENRIKVGDSVRIGNDGGVVEYVGVMSIRVRLWSGEILTIPNSAVMGSPVYNYSLSLARRVELNVGISYDSDVDKAIKAIRNVLWDNELVLAEPEPSVLVDSFGESSIVLRVLFWTPSQEFLSAKSSAANSIKRALEREGIEIPYPQRVVWLRGQQR